MATIDINSTEWIEYEAKEAAMVMGFLSRNLDKVAISDLAAIREKQGWSEEDIDLAYCLTLEAKIMAGLTHVD